MVENNKNTPGKIETSVLSQNKIPGCDQLTRPEEIKALSKYLGNIKKVQEKHTTLQKDNLEVPGRTTGRIPKVEIPDFVDSLVTSKNKKAAVPYKESSRVPLEKNHDPAELNNAVVGLEDDREIKLNNRIYGLKDDRNPKLVKGKVSLKKTPEEPELKKGKIGLEDDREIGLGKTRVGLEDTRETTLENYRESLTDDRKPSLSEYRETLGNVEPVEDLGNYRESLEDFRKTTLGNHRERLEKNHEPAKLNNTVVGLTDDRETTLGKVLEKLKNIEALDSLDGTRIPLDGAQGLESYTIVRAPSGETENLTELPDTVEPLKNVEPIEELRNYREELTDDRETELPKDSEKLDFGEGLEGSEKLENYKDPLSKTPEPIEELGNHVEELTDNRETTLPDIQEPLDFGDNLGGPESVEDYREPLNFGENLGGPEAVEDHVEKLDFGERLGDDDNFLEDHVEKLTDNRETTLENYVDPLNYGDNLGGPESVEDYREPLNFGDNLGDSDNFVEDHVEPLDFGDRFGDDDNFVEDHVEKLDFGDRFGDDDNFVEDHVEKLDFGDRFGDDDNFVEDHVEKLDFGDNLEPVEAVEDYMEPLDYGERLGDDNNFLEDHVEELTDDRDTTLEDFIDELTDDRETELPDHVEELGEHIDGNRSERTPNYFDRLGEGGELYDEAIGRPDSSDDPENYIELDTKLNKEETTSATEIVSGGLYDSVVARPEASQDSPRADGIYSYIRTDTNVDPSTGDSITTTEIEDIKEISKLTGNDMYNAAMRFIDKTQVSEWENKVKSLVSTYLSGSKISPDKALEFEIKMGKEMQVFMKTINASVGDDEDDDTEKNEDAFNETFGSTKKQTKPVNRTGIEETPENVSRDDGGKFPIINEYDSAKNSLRGKKQDMPPMKLPSFNLDSLNINNYLRYTAEKTIGAITSGGLRETLIQETLAGLVWARDELERVSKSNRDRLPGSNMGLVSDLVSGGVSGALDNLGSRLGNSITNVLGGSDSVNMNNPVNRPDGEEQTTGWTETGKRISQSQTEYSTNNNQEKTVHNAIVTSSSSESGNNSSSFWKKVGQVAKETFLGGESNEINYKFKDNYLSGAGIKTTIDGLCGDSSKDAATISTVEELMSVLSRDGGYITSASKFTSTKNNTYRIQTLDSDAYWEIILEPFVGEENGNLSYLPGLHEINLINIAQHGVNTGYNRWIPFQGFELQKAKLTNKTLQLYDGEISYPISMEYLNEFRLTIADDQYKSWRTYFERCAKAAVYNSEGHGPDFYTNASELTAIDTGNVVVAMYKNITFRCQIYIMTPQFSTIHKYDLLLVMKDFSEEHSGSIDGGAGDLSISFSIVGENPNVKGISYTTKNRYYPSENFKEDNTSSSLVGSIVEKGINTVVGLIK